MTDVTATAPADDHTDASGHGHGHGHEGDGFSAEEPGAHHGPSDIRLIQIAVVLAVVTGVEVLISYVDIGPLFIPGLLGLMVFKFFVVVLYFMHLKFDNPIFRNLFWMGLFLAPLVFCGALATFHFFSP